MHRGCELLLPPHETDLGAGRQRRSSACTQPAPTHSQPQQHMPHSSNERIVLAETRHWPPSLGTPHRGHDQGSSQPRCSGWLDEKAQLSQRRTETYRGGREEGAVEEPLFDEEWVCKPLANGEWRGTSSSMERGATVLNGGRGKEGSCTVSPPRGVHELCTRCVEHLQHT